MINEVYNFATTEHSMALTSSVNFGQTKREANKLGHDKPAQTILQTYPTTHIGMKNRLFSSQWFIKYRWLEYSVRQDRCYCYPKVPKDFWAE